MLGKWAPTMAYLKFITMLGISHKATIGTNIYGMEFNQFHSFNQNLK